MKRQSGVWASWLLWLDSQIELAKKKRRLLNITMSPTAELAPEAVIENIFGEPECIQIGDYSYIRGRLLTYGHGGRIEIGQWCYLGERSEVWSMELIQIGDHVLIGHDVNIHDGTGHPYNAHLRREHFKTIRTVGHPRTQKELPGVISAPVIIEEDVSIGFGTTIFHGVRIGSRSVIAPRSIITKDVPPDVMYISTPKPLMIPLDLLEKMRTEKNA